MTASKHLGERLDLFDLPDVSDRAERCQCARCREQRVRSRPAPRDAALARTSIERRLKPRASEAVSQIHEAPAARRPKSAESSRPGTNATHRASRAGRSSRSSRGIALVSVLIAMLLLSTIGAGLVIVTSADTLIGANVGAASETFYAANAAFERTLAELRIAPDLSALLSGSAPSAFTDGTAGGVRELTDGTRVNLTQAVSLANCSRLAGCSEADMNAGGRDRPWGSRNPRWRLFSYGPFAGSMSGGAQSSWPTYVLTFLADDPLETDSDPLRDGVQTSADSNPGAGIILIRAEAYGRRRARRTVEGSVLRRDVSARAVWESLPESTRGSPPSSTPVLQLLAWREVR